MSFYFLTVSFVCTRCPKTIYCTETDKRTEFFFDIIKKYEMETKEACSLKMYDIYPHSDVICKKKPPFHQG